MKNVDLSPLWTALRELFAEQHFTTILCGFLIVVISIKFYRFLKSISPALVPLALLLVLFVLVLHWTQTRTEPELLKPAMDSFVRVLPLSGTQR